MRLNDDSDGDGSYVFVLETLPALSDRRSAGGGAGGFTPAPGVGEAPIADIQCRSESGHWPNRREVGFGASRVTIPSEDYTAPLRLIDQGNLRNRLRSAERLHVRTLERDRS